MAGRGPAQFAGGRLEATVHRSGEPGVYTGEMAVEVAQERRRARLRLWPGPWRRDAARTSGRWPPSRARRRRQGRPMPYRQASSGLPTSPRRPHRWPGRYRAARHHSLDSGRLLGEQRLHERRTTWRCARPAPGAVKRYGRPVRRPDSASTTWGVTLRLELTKREPYDPDAFAPQVDGDADTGGRGRVAPDSGEIEAGIKTLQHVAGTFGDQLRLAAAVGPGMGAVRARLKGWDFSRLASSVGHR